MRFSLKHFNGLKKLPLLLIIWIFLLVASCGPQVTPRPTDTGVTPAADPTGLPVPPESPTPKPTDAPNKVVLLALPGSDPTTVIALQELLAELAAVDGLTVEARQEPVALDLDPTVRIVVAVPPDPGLANLAAANPIVQFLGVGISGIESAQNLSVIGAGGGRPDQQGFLAGYVAAVITPDWRVGVVSVPESTAGKAARAGFGNGVIFFCGLCRPAYPPYIQYPIFANVPAGAGPVEFQTAVDALAANAVKTVYVAPEISDPSIHQMLVDAGLQIIGSGDPPAFASDLWVASINVDEMDAVRQVWPHLLAGEQGANLEVPLVLSQVNPARLTAGRLRVVENVLSDLVAGYIDTGIDPQTGDPR